MNTSERMLLFAHHETSPAESLYAAVELAFYPSARQAYRRYVRVSDLLRRSLEDDQIVVNVTLRKPLSAAKSRSLLVLCLLGILIFFEYRNFTVPVLREWIQTAAHRCGL